MQRPTGGVIAAAATALAVVAAFCLTAEALRAQQDAPQAPVFRSGVDLVAVDVGVFDKQGHPVRNLGARDFTVTVSGQQRRIVSAEFVDVAAARPAASGPPDASVISSNDGVGVGRLFVFVVDQNTLEPGNVRHVARAASRFFSGLSFVDRSALMLMPAGPNINFTWAHDRVREALQRVIGQATASNSWEFGSLSEARDIANRNVIALRTVGQRECGGGISASSGFDGLGPISSGPVGGPTPAPTQPSGGGGSPGGQGGGGSGGTSPSGGTPSSGNSGSGGGSSRGRSTGFGMDSCTRDVQMRAEWTWRSAQMTSMASITALRHVLSALERVPGDKTIILISGGWPMDEREQNSLLGTVADDAAAARATVFTMIVPGSTSSANLRRASITPANDHWIQSWPLETLASMTGGGSFRVDVGAESAFERMSRELGGYYRLGIERDATDADGKSRRMKVQVARGSTTVRAREVFDARTFQDRNWSARLASALDSPIPATGIGLRITSYLAADPDDATRLKLVLAGEASRVEPGDAEFQLVVQDLEGNKLLTGEKPLGQPTGDGLSFSANVPLAPGSYIIRVAVIDGSGRVGSVDHRADVQPVKLGSAAAVGPVLIRVPSAPEAQPRVAMNTVRQDERLALQVDLEGMTADASEVVFQIASSAEGPSLVEAAATLSAGSREGSLLAQAVADMRVLPAGEYIARAQIKTNGGATGVIRRAFNVLEAPPPVLADAAVARITPAGRIPAAHPTARSVVALPRFAIEDVLAAPMLGAFLDRVAARADATAPDIRAAVERARSAGVAQLEVSDALAAESAVASFLRGLSLLANKQPKLAAQAFRNAMRASADFYPAMVYLGACFAADGNDKEAAGAWRTALIKEGETLPLYTILADALLRQDKGQLALQTLDTARTRWPADDGLKRRFVVAALMAGEYADGLMTLDELIDRRAEDEPALAAGLLALYEAFANDRPIDDAEKDRARMTRLAEVYRARGGPSTALIDSWLAAANRKN
jgi:VWFA-related protein